MISSSSKLVDQISVISTKYTNQSAFGRRRGQFCAILAQRHVADCCFVCIYVDLWLVRARQVNNTNNAIFAI